MAEAAKVVWRADKEASVEFYARADGLFTFTEWTLSGEEPYPYWRSTYQSGFHASEAEAEAEARAVIPWLRADRDA